MGKYKYEFPDFPNNTEAKSRIIHLARVERSDLAIGQGSEI